MARILFVTGYYPPHAPAGAVRPPKLVKHWVAAGHDVRVIAIDNRNLGATLVAEADATVAHLPWQPGHRPAPAAQAAPAVAPGSEYATRPTGFLARLKQIYRQSQVTPDRYAGWVAPAVAQGEAWARAGWRPDLIYSSGPPQRGHVVAAGLARRLSAPWVAELRDLWVGNPYVELAAPIRWQSERLGRQTLGAAQAFVAVTEGAAAELRHQHPGRPVEVAMNGFDPEDFAGMDSVPPLDPHNLTIIHAGVIYAGRRDPTALIKAIALLPAADRARIRVRFYHDEFGFVRELVAAHGVEAQVEMLPLVPRAEILRVERQADVLLLCRWADRQDDAVIPGKVFEYIGARRPILAVGSETGEASDIVRAGPFGLVSNDPAAIAAQLSRWLVEKDKAGGRLPDLPAGPTAPYGRAGAFARIDAFLARIAPATARARHDTNQEH